MTPMPQQGSETPRSRGSATGETMGTSWVDHTGPTVVATRHQVAQFNRDGFFVLAGAFHPDSMTRLATALSIEGEIDLRDGVDPHLDEPPTDVVRRFCGHPLLAGLARDLVGPDAGVLSDRAVVLRDHEPVAEFRRECNPHPHGHRSITCWVAVTDARSGNGAVQVVRGGHRRPAASVDLTDPGRITVGPDEAADVMEIECASGSVVVMSAWLPRRIGPNVSGRSALAHAIHYAPDLSPTDDESRTRLTVVRDGQLVFPG